MRTDRGETLLELLVAVVLMGIALVAVVGGLATSILVSDVHRKQATAGASVRDYAEALAKVVAGGGYIPCAAPAAYTSTPGFDVPTGFSKTTTAVRYWTGSAWAGSCGTDSGLQQLSIQVASNDGRATERLVIVLRRPCKTTDSPCPAT
jgi:type II secretory pathway pseudopilin PulG